MTVMVGMGVPGCAAAGDTGPGRPGQGFVELDRNGLEVLNRHQCLKLLASATLGRVGITLGALPVILPVNFRLVAERILFRTGAGTKLAAATRNIVVAFEVDAIDPLSDDGWSVVVTGCARRLHEPARLEALAAADIPGRRWSRSDHVVEVSTDMITGRRLLPPGER